MLRGVLGCEACLLAALALQVVHGVDRNRVTAHAVDFIHGDPPSEKLAVEKCSTGTSPGGPSPYNRNTTDVIPLHVVISGVSRTVDSRRVRSHPAHSSRISARSRAGQAQSGRLPSVHRDLRSSLRGDDALEHSGLRGGSQRGADSVKSEVAGHHRVEVHPPG